MADVYIATAPGTYVRSQELAPGVLADYDEDDRIIGLEVNSALNLTFDTGGVLRVSNVGVLRVSIDRPGSSDDA